MLPLILSLAWADPAAAPATVKVPIARHDLAPGTRITRDDVRLQRTLPDFVPDLALRDVDAAVGRVVRETILEGELLRPERLADPGAPEGLAGALPRGLQLVRLEPTLAAPLVVPGAFVDVLDGARFCVVLEAAHVLGVETDEGDVHTSGAPDTQRAWHLAVTPPQAQQLLGLSSYTLALRAEVDVTALPPELLCPKG